MNKPRPLFRVTFALLTASLAATPVLAEVRFAKQPGPEASSRTFSAKSDSRLLTLHGTDVVVDTQTSKPLVGLLPNGEEITANGSTIKLGPGTIWLPNFSWAGDAGAKADLLYQNSEGKRVEASYTCSADRTLLETRKSELERDTKALAVGIALPSHQTITLGCRSGDLRISFQSD